MGVSLLLLQMLSVRLEAQPNMPRDFAIEVSATVQASPPRIRLEWPGDARALSYQVYKKQLDEGSWQSIASLPGNAATYEDLNVVVGTPYEYGLIKKTTRELTGYGYVYSAIDAPLMEDRGKLILLVDSSVAGAVGAELTRLQQDLAGDGWTVLRQDVSRSAWPAEVKAIIKAAYEADRPNVKSVFLLGHLPVAYSGNIAPDGHENHRGAWPADVYYADMDGTWTDTSVLSTNAEKRVNWNIPGDGKFDQSEPPSAVELQIGRVDLSNLTAFANKAVPRSEVDLLRQYLNKNHNFRHGRIIAERRGLICDNFQDKGVDPVGNSGWRNFSAFFGAQNVKEVPWGEYLTNATARSYLWSYGAGGGSTYYMAAGVATSDEFATMNLQVVFTMFLGSFFGDWDNESNFLRCALGSGNVLTASYGGFPHWHYQHMGLGHPIGFSAQLTQNINRGGPYPPHNQGTHEVHIALLGDPTLRMHPVLPPGALNSSVSGGAVTLTWERSPDTSLVGYHLYRSVSLAGPFVRVTGGVPVTAMTFTDQPPAGSHVYMVRAIKRELSGGGTYLNPSQGVFATATVVSAEPPASVQIGGSAVVNGVFTLQLVGQSGQRYAVETSSDLKQWTEVATGSFRGSTATVADAQSGSFKARFYRVKSL